MRWSGPERRRHPRASCHAEAVIYVDEREIGRFHVRDVSLGGALLVGETDLETGQRVNITLIVREHGIVRIEADVLRVQHSADETALGVAFRQAPSPVAQLMEELVLGALARQTPDSDDER